MSPLAWFLACIFTLSASCLLLAAVSVYSKGPDIKIWFKRVVVLYAAAVAFILGGMIYYFIGWGNQGSPRIPRNLQRRIAHTGYYFARDGELKLLGEATAGPKQLEDDQSLERTAEEGRSYEVGIIRQLISFGRSEADGDLPSQGATGDTTLLGQGFVQPRLEPGESLTLKPVWEGDKAAEWMLTYKVNSRPLRLRSVENVSQCVNVTPERWLNPGDTIFLTLERGGATHFISIKWSAASKYWGPFARMVNAYYFGQGVIRNGVPAYEKGPDLLMSERVLIDGLSLADLVKRSRREFRAQIGIIDQEWWNAFSGVVLVRESRGDRNSRVGILIADEVAQLPELKIYRNYGNGSSPPLVADSVEKTIKIPTTTDVAYGFRGSRKSFELVLTDEVVRDQIWREIVHVNFEHPLPWELPPTPTTDFIITSNNDYIPLDGYFLEIGNSSHSFYAKARLNQSLDELSINDGRNVVRDKQEAGSSGESDARSFHLGQPASLGDYEQGVLITLVRAQIGGQYAELATRYLGAPYIGLAATALIIVNALFLVLAAKKNSTRPKLFLAWTLIWGVTLALLAVRFVLAYRVSLVPPPDATLAEIRNVFGKGVDYSLGGLGIFAFLTFLLFFAERSSSQKWWATWRTVITVILWGLIIVGYTIAGAYLGENQSFGIRISIADHLMLVGGLAWLTGPALDSQPRFGWLMALIVFLALVLQIFVVKDAGSIIYSLSLLLCVGMLWGLHKPIGLLKLAPYGLPLAAIVMVLTPYLIQTSWMRKAARPALPETTFYRFASFTDSEEEILMTKSGDEEADMSKLLDNSRQDWQMLLYASHGAAAPVGYGQAPLSKIGMTYATSVSDCAFSTYLLAEHGKAAALFLLLVYFLLACSCVLAGWYLDSTVRRRNVALVAIGAFFACNALYMAGANIGLFIFTGQNLPLLGLNSGGDLLQGLVLTALAGWLLLGSQESTPKYLKQPYPVVFGLSLLFFVVLIVGLAAINWRMNKIGRDDRYRLDHNFKPEVFKRIDDDLPPDSANPNRGKNAPIILTNDKLGRVPGGQLIEIEEQYIKQFNERTDKFNPSGGLYYLERVRGAAGANELGVGMNRRFFYARSPFSEPALWRGQIVAGGESDPTVYALNNRLRISLSAGGYPGSVNLANSQSIRTNSSVLLYEYARQETKQFFELKRKDDQVRLDPKSGKWSVFVDGKQLSGPANIAPLSIIVVESRDAKYRRNLIYLGPTRPILAYVRWRNGEQRRMFPESGLTLVYMLGKAGDQAAALETKLTPAERKLKDELPLSLDVSLNQTLQQELARYASHQPNYSPFRPRPNRLAVTVLDAFSGQVLALPTWPTLDPDNAKYESLIDKITEQTRYRFEENHNLTPHVIGSTIKPIVFATMATALRQADYDLARVKIYNRSDVYSGREHAVHPHLRLGGIRIGVWGCNSSQLECDMRDFIVRSLDFPEGLLGMLGMLNSEQEIARVFIRNDTSPDLSYEGRGYKFDLMRASEDATAFSIQDQREGKNPSTRGPEVMNSTILFRGLASVFDFDTANLQEKEAWLSRTCANFLPTFNNQKLPLKDNNYLDNVIPSRLDLSGGSFQNVRGGLISCLLGGGDCRFSNVRMAQAAARIVTGQRVFARLETTPAAQVDSLPDPLGNLEWRNANIITPMQLVGEIGTAKALRKTVKVPAQYRAIYKTGTILEGDESEGRESEALMFIIGRWENGSFLKGETLAGFLYMEKSKAKNPSGGSVADGNMKKFDFAAPVLNKLITYLTSVKRTLQ